MRYSVVDKAMSAPLLIKFINHKVGPVVSISSTPYPGFWRRRLWHSTAKLHPNWNFDVSSPKIFGACSGCWSRDKGQSQCKAVTEAIERWVYRCYYKFAPKDAGLDIDPTSNGFAALPCLLAEQKLLVNAYCEAAERWMLNRMWDYGDVSFQICRIENNDFAELFCHFKGRLHLFSANLAADKGAKLPVKEIVFFLCIFETDTGGAIPGSACGENVETVTERALAEAYINVMAFNRMKKEGICDFENILEQRLYYFGNSKNGYSAVMHKINISANPVRHGIPEVLFSKRLAGEWNPEVLAHRILIKGSIPVINGGVERFVI